MRGGVSLAPANPPQRRFVARARRVVDENDDGGAAENEGGDVASSDRVPIPFRQLSKRRKGPYDPNCFGCKWDFRQPENARDEPAMHRLWRTFVENRSKVNDTQVLCHLISEKQRVEFVEAFRREGKECPEWPKEKVYEHIMDHMVDYETDLLSDLREQREVCRFLLDNISTRPRISGDGGRPVTSGDGGMEEVKPDLNVIKAYANMSKLKQETWVRIRRDNVSI